MKELKAYIRRGEINEVVENLQRAGAPGVSVIEIHPVGYGTSHDLNSTRTARNTRVPSRCSQPAVSGMAIQFLGDSWVNERG